MLDFLQRVPSYQLDIEAYSSTLATILTLVQEFKQEIDNLPFQLNVTFFPHQGSTWSSLESVWRAFQADARCTTKIVLTPVYRNTPNGIKVLYQDYLTPEGISFIQHDAYDIKADKPDIAFSSNPYESVSFPQFTPQNLHENATALVYVPYFIESVVLEKDLLTHYNMFMHNNAWMVVCQSEEMKRKYGEYSQSRGRNVMVLGSPKMDALLRASQETVEIPAEWLEKANGRKVILHTTHFSANPEKSIQYVENMYSLYSSQEWRNVVLLWRPHPMTRTVLSGYYPDYYKLWCSMLSKLCSLDNVILDESASYRPAFQISDGLYSSGLSSMVIEYMITGKPIIIDDFTSDPQLKHLVLDLSGCYLAPQDWEGLKKSLVEFKTKLELGEDLMKEKRLTALRNGIANLDGRAGERIKDIVIEMFLRQFNHE
jgi:hypothetical protein